MTTRSKKLLFVANVSLYPLDRGERVRVFRLIEACAKEFEVTFVGPRPAVPGTAQIPTFIAHYVPIDIELRSEFDWRIYIHALFSGIGLPFDKLLRSRIKFLRALRDMDLNSFDLIWTTRLHFAPLLRGQRSRTVVDFDDVEHLKLHELMQLQRPSLRWLRNCYRYMIYRFAELRGFRDFLRIVVCSPKDQSYLQTRGAGNVHVVPNGATVPTTPESPRSRSPGERLRAVFLGNMGYEPNIDAVGFFADEVLPAASATVESFDVIGSNVPPELNRTHAGRVRFRGYVDELGGALREYDVMVVPIRFGSGTKLKVLDAMANGIPIVSTPQGAEGLDLVDGESALLASTPAEMALALMRLAESPQLCRQIAAGAHSLARSRFSWESIQDALASELVNLARQ
jgi:polysaccharide biosynthesis protein PslH